MKFIPSNRSNPCPVCTDTKGKCRSKQTDFTLPNGSTKSDRQFLCMRIHGDNNGYKFTGDTSDGLWGKTKLKTIQVVNTIAAKGSSEL